MRRWVFGVAALAAVACGDADLESGGAPVTQANVDSRLGAARAVRVIPKPAAAPTLKEGELAIPAPETWTAPAVAARGRLLQRLPRSSLAVLRLPHVERLGEAWSRTPMKALFDNPLVAAQRTQFEGQIAVARAELEARVSDFAQLEEALLGLSGELVIAITAVDAQAFTGALAKNGAFPFTVALLFDAGPKAKAADALIVRICELVNKTPETKLVFELVTPGELRWHRRFKSDAVDLDLVRDDDCFLVQIGPRSKASTAPLASRPLNDSFCATDVVRGMVPTDGAAAAGGGIAVAEAWLNLTPVWSALELLAPAEVKEVLAAGGFTGIGGISLAAVLKDHGIDESLALHAPSGRDLFSLAVTTKPLAKGLARYLPADFGNAGLAVFDLGGVVEQVVSLLPTEARAGFDQVCADAKRQTGIDLQGDLFGNFGPTFGFASPGGVGSGAKATEFVVVLEVQDAARARRLIERLLKDSSAAQAVQSMTIDGTDVRTLMLPPLPLPTGETMQLQPTWCFGDRCLVVASSPGLLKRVLATAKNPDAGGPVKLREALAQAGSGAFAANVTVFEGSPASVMVGRRVPSGLLFESVAGAGALTSGALVGGVAVAASVAIPVLLASRLEANERHAVEMLRAIRDAQERFRSDRIVDVDEDGHGEFGTLAELTGSAPARGPTQAVTQPPAAPLLGAALKPDGTGVAQTSGYLIRVELAAGGGRSVFAVPTIGQSGILTDFAELNYVAYAWPLQHPATGVKVYVLDASGKIFFTQNSADLQHYSGTDRPPGVDASLLRDPGDRVNGVTAVRRGRDGGIWLELE